jgi:acyl-CoA synthetase (AMP-forming)/AMP-acid ligase II
MKNPALEILKWADHCPDRPALIAEEGTLTYRQLRGIVTAFAVQLVKHGIGTGSTVAIETKNSFAALYATLAVALVGARWVQNQEFLHRSRVLKIDHVLFTGKPPAGLTAPAIGMTDAWKKIDQDDRRFLAEIRGNRGDDDTWMFACSSGTTGTPKLMALTYEKTLLRTQRTALTHDLPHVSTCCLFPPLSFAWISTQLKTLWVQGTIVLSRNIDFLHANNVAQVLGSPQHLEAFLKFNEGKQDLKLKTATVLGSSISAPFCNRLLSRFALIQNLYGSTETGGISRKEYAAPGEDTTCVGTISSWNHVKIVDKDHRNVQRGECGLIGVRNDLLVKEYINNPNATKRCFNSGWFYSGDIGYLNEKGELFVVGRSDDVINIGGVKRNAESFDRLIEQCGAVDGALCFVLPGSETAPRLAALVMRRNDVSEEDCLASIRKASS